MILRSARRFRATATEIIPAAANWHSFRGHVGDALACGRRTPTVDPQTWHRSRSMHPLSQNAFRKLCDIQGFCDADAPRMAQPSRLLSQLDTDFVT